MCVCVCVCGCRVMKAALFKCTKQVWEVNKVKRKIKEPNESLYKRFEKGIASETRKNRS